MMGRRQKLIDGYEEDLVCNRRIYSYLKNTQGIRRYIKRKLNKRYRREAREACRLS